MKKSLLLIACLCSAMGLGAQETPPVQGEVIVEKREEFTIPGNERGERRNKSALDVSVNTVFGSQFKRSAKRLGWERGHWAGISLYYNGLVDNLASLAVPADASYLSLSSKSIGVALNPVDVTLIHGRRLGLLTGLGFEFNNFRFDQDVTLTSVDGVTVPDYSYRDQGIDLTKSKLFTCYINMPLLLEIQIGNKQNFFINAGVIGGMNIGEHTKIKAESPQFTGTKKSHASLNLRNFHYGYTVNIGYNDIALTMTYYQSQLFRPGQGPEVRQINIGLSIML